MTTGDFTTGNSASGVITQGLGASKPANAYFLKMISAATGGTVENFSPRFTLSGLDGVFPSAVTAGLVDVSGTSGPATVNNVANPQQAAPGAGTAEVAGGQYSVAYTAQTGLSRYAPMPPIPGTQITAKNASPQFPTSAFTPYPSAAGSPNAVTTMTASETQHASSIENPVRGEAIEPLMLIPSNDRTGIRCREPHRYCDVQIFEQVEGLKQKN